MVGEGRLLEVELGMLLEVWLGMLLEVGEVVVGKQSFHMQELEVGNGMVGEGTVGECMVKEGTLLEA